MQKLTALIRFALITLLIVAAPSYRQAQVVQDSPSSPRLTALQKLLDAGDRSALEKFWEEIARQGTPLVEPVIGDARHMLVTFLWRAQGETKNVLLFSYSLTFPDSIGISQGRLNRLGESDIWFKTFIIRNDARFSYVFSPNDSLLPEQQPQRMANLRPDPLNPNRFPDLESPQASVVELPGAPPQPWIRKQDGEPQGKVTEHKFRSRILNNERSVRVYTPHGYDPKGQAYSLVVLFDGYTYTTIVPTPTILDNLIARGEVPPLVAVMIDSISNEVRLRELHCDENFTRSLAEEMIPWVRENYRVTADPGRTIVGGSSAGGLAAAFAGLKHPEIFGNVLSQSGSFSWKPGLLERVLNGGRPGPLNEGRYTDSGWLIRQYAMAPRLALRFYLDVGLFEDLAPRKPIQAGDTSQAGDFSGLVANRYFRDVLLAKGYSVIYREYNGGHSYLNARELLADGLIELIGAKKHGDRHK